VISTGATGKPLRADARRNYEALLAAGKAVFSVIAICAHDR
jgi:hypothetical protein